MTSLFAVGLAGLLLAACEDAAPTRQPTPDASNLPDLATESPEDTGGPRRDLAEATDLAAPADLLPPDLATADGAAIDLASEVASDVALDGGTPLPGDRLLELGAGQVLAVEFTPFRLTLYRDGRLVARTAQPAVQAGLVAELDPALHLDPHLDEHGRGNLPPGLRWVDLEQVVASSEDGAATELILTGRLSDGGALALRLRVAEPGRAELTLTDLRPAANIPIFLRIRWEATPAEAYYGLGESFAQVQRRGTVQAMHFEVAAIESGYNEAHVPIPFFVGTRGWGCFVEDRHPGSFDMARLERQVVSATFATTELRVHLFAAADPLRVVAAYTLLTGPPAVPAEWAFAPMQWRNEHRDGAQVLEDARAMRQWRLPGSTIWIDNPWQTAYNSFEFDPVRFPDPAGLISELHGLGYRVVVWSTPYLEEATGEPYQTALAEGLFVDYTPFFDKFGLLVDLTHPGAIDLWRQLISRVTQLGVEGFKLDYGEDVQTGAGLMRLVHRFHNGEDERTMHHGYQLYFHRPYAEALPATGGFILSRAGTYGDQALSTTIWPGDLCNDFRRFGEDGHVGGLPAAIIGGLTLSASGFPFFASDIGGFRHGRPTGEVLVRWAAYAALHPVMQLGGGGVNHNPWDFTEYQDEPRYDQQTLAAYWVFATLHMRLFPYAYTLARAARDEGLPVIRPFGLAYPRDGRHPDFTFLYGPWLLVSPVADGRTPVEVPLPGGRWLDWFSGEVVTGRSVHREVPLDEVPLYLAEGGIVPLLRPGVDTLAPATVPGVDSLDRFPGALHVRLWPQDAGSRQTVFDGAVIEALRQADEWALEVVLTAGARFAGWVLQLEWRAAWDDAPAPLPAVVLADGIPLPRVAEELDLGDCDACWYGLTAKGQVLVTLPPGDARLELRAEEGP